MFDQFFSRRVQFSPDLPIRWVDHVSYPKGSVLPGSLVTQDLKNKDRPGRYKAVNMMIISFIRLRTRFLVLFCSSINKNATLVLVNMSLKNDDITTFSVLTNAPADMSTDKGERHQQISKKFLCTCCSRKFSKYFSRPYLEGQINTCTQAGDHTALTLIWKRPST